MEDCQLFLFLDCRTAEPLIFYAVRDVFVQQCVEIFSLVSRSCTHDSNDLLVPGQRPSSTARVFVSLYTILADRVDVHLDRICASDPGAALDHILGRLEALRSLRGVSMTTRGAFKDPLQVIHSVLRAISTTARGEQQQKRQLALIMTSFIPHTELYYSLTGVCDMLSTDCAVYGVVADSAAVCLTSVHLCPKGRLHRCSVDPDDMRAALQDSLCDHLLLSPHWHFDLVLQEKDSGWPRSPREVLKISCVAERSYLARPQRASWEDGISMGSTGTLEALLDPRNVDELFLCGDPWVVHADTALQALEGSGGAVVPECGTPPAALFNILYEQMQSDVLVLRIDGSEGAVWMLGIFADRTHLILRNVLPPHLRRAQPNVLLARSAVESAVVNAVQHVRHVLLTHSGTFSLDAAISDQ